MLRLTFPLVLLAAIAAAHGSHAQTSGGDRYGPRNASASAGPVALPVSALPVSAPVGGAPAIRRLSWPGKAELRPLLAPANYVAPSPTAAPAVITAPPASAAARFPGMSVYGASPPAPALRGARATTYANTPLPSAAWSPAPARSRTRPGVSGAHASPAQEPADRAPLASTVAPSLAFPPPPTAAGLPTPAVAVASAPARATTPSRDALSTPTVGRFGYVGPGREAPAAGHAPAPLAQAHAPAPATAVASTGGLGAPHPPAYARGYVLAPAATAPVSAAPVTAPSGSAPSGSALPPPPLAAAAGRSPDGVRRYSVRREFGEEPDPIRLSPQTLAAAPDLSAPETPEPAPRSGAAAGRAQVNAARLAASGPN